MKYRLIYADCKYWKSENTKRLPVFVTLKWIPNQSIVIGRRAFTRFLLVQRKIEFEEILLQALYSQTIKIDFER